MDVGLFETPDGSEFDLRGNLAYELRPWKRLSLRLGARYEGMYFAADGQALPESGALTDSGHVSLGLTLNLFERSGLGLRYQLNRDGIRSEFEQDVITTGLSVSSRPFEKGPWFVADYSFTDNRLANGENNDSNSLSIKASQRFSWGSASAQYRRRNPGHGKISRSSHLIVSRNPWQFQFRKQAEVSFAPNLVASEVEGDSQVRLGFLLNFDTGHLLGRRWRLSGSLGQLQALNDATRTESDESEAADAGEENETPDSFFTLQSRYRLGRGLELKALYSTDFDDGDHFSLQLKGRLGVNPPRRYKIPLAGRGILKGRVFFDANNNGVLDDSERGFGGAPVGLVGTPYWLNADPQGYFTIHNLPAGSYRPQLDRAQLPINLMLGGDKAPVVAVAEARITEIALAAIQSGQIKGQAFVDRNNNGVADTGEGIEDLKLVLFPGGHTAYTTVFGQYVFERLPEGRYALWAVPSHLPENLKQIDLLPVELSATKGLMQQMNLRFSGSR